MKAVYTLLGTGFGLGRVPVIPGTLGTLPGCAFWWAIKDLPIPLFLLLLAGGFVLGARISMECEKIYDRKDPRWIVIDEIMAFPLVMFLVPAGWTTLLLGFVLFRIFDIVKPWPLRRLETLPHGYGVMADDYGAALYACGTLHLGFYFFPLTA